MVQTSLLEETNQFFHLIGILIGYNSQRCKYCSAT